MDYKSLGRTGLKVSPLCLGTMNFGPRTTEPDSYAIMDRALALGINFFDTADVYGQKMGEGVTGWVAEHKSVVALSSNAGSDARFKRFQALIAAT